MPRIRLPIALSRRAIERVRRKYGPKIKEVRIEFGARKLGVRRLMLLDGIEISRLEDLFRVIALLGIEEKLANLDQANELRAVGADPEAVPFSAPPPGR